MGKKLDALLGRSFKPSKLRGTARLALSRLPTLKSQRQARCSTARSDVVQFLQSANHERALLRVEQVIKEQNMLDVFVALEGYCHLLVERISLFEQHKFCPDELLEAVSTLIYASTRCGEFPELLELRAIFTSKFGKEFAMRAVELRNNCAVNPRIIQKLSTRMPSLEQKMEVIKEIASDNNIVLPTPEAKADKHQESSMDSPALGVGGKNEEEEIERGPRRKYKDVADAAQAAFESAAYAAAAARAAVELSRTESTDDSTTPRVVSKVHEDKGMEESSKPVRRSFSSSSSDSDSSDDEGDGDVKGKNLAFDRDELGSGSGRGAEPLNLDRRPISVRTRWAQVR